MTELPILPAFSENNVAVTMQSSDYFAPYTSVTIQSILDHTTKNHNYDIIVTSKDMSEDNAEILCSMADAFENVSIRVVNVKKIYDSIIQVEDERFGGETVTRIFLMELLPDYDKVLNLDSDMIVCADVAELYNTDITNYYMGAVQDLQSYISYYKYTNVYFNHEFVNHVLGLDSIESYYNGGLFLLNLKKIRTSFTSKEIANTIIKNKFRFLEQDAFSSLFHTAVLGLDWQWNWQCDADRYFESHINTIFDISGYRNKFNDARKNPKIIHYLTTVKPWANERIYLASIWWERASHSPFYNVILDRCYKIAKYRESATKLLFVCETPYHLFNVIQLKCDLYEDAPADIVFTASADFSNYIENLKELKLFQTIYESPYTVKKDIKKLRSTAPNKDIVKYPERYEHYIDLSADYSDYFMPVISSPYQKILYFTLIKKGKPPRVHIFEDGAITYVEDVLSGNSKDTLCHKGIPKARSFLENVCEILVRNPGLYIANNNKIPVTKLPSFSNSNSKAYDVMMSVFGTQKLPEEKYIFFNEPFTSEGLLTNEIDILEEISQYVGKENMTVKLHPRAWNEYEKYLSKGFKIYSNNTPWETVCMNPEIENKVLLSISSNSLVTPWSVGGKKPFAVYLWKIMKLSRRHHVREVGFTKFISLIEKQMNYFDKRMFCPDTMAELIEIIKYIRGEVK